MACGSKGRFGWTVPGNRARWSAFAVFLSLALVLLALCLVFRSQGPWDAVEVQKDEHKSHHDKHDKHHDDKHDKHDKHHDDDEGEKSSHHSDLDWEPSQLSPPQIAFLGALGCLVLSGIPLLIMCCCLEPELPEEATKEDPEAALPTSVKKVRVNPFTDDSYA